MSRRRLLRPTVAVPAALVVLVVLLTLGSGDDRYRVRVAIDDAAGLRQDFDVKIAGAPVGTVVDVDLDREDRAIADLRLDGGAAPIGLDARAAVRASNLLGEKYVDIDPGDLARPAPSGHLIPRDRSTTPSDLDDILSVLDADTRVALAAFLAGQGEALAGRGADLATTLSRLPSTLDEARRLVAGLADDNRALGSLVERSDRVLRTLGPERRELGRLVTTASGAFAALDGRRRHLGDTVRRAPGAVRQLRGTLIELERAAGPLGPAARGLEETAAPLTTTLRALPAFAEAARPTLRTARNVAPSLTRLGREATPVVRRLQPAASDLRTFGAALEPVSEALDHGIADVLGTMQGWARAIQNRDGAGHVFRVSAELGGDVLGALDRMGRRDAPGRGRRARPQPRPDSDRRADAPEAAPERRHGLDLPALKLPKVPLPKVRLPETRLPEARLPEARLPDLGRDGSSRDVAEPLLDFLLRP